MQGASQSLEMLLIIQRSKISATPLILTEKSNGLFTYPVLVLSATCECESLVTGSAATNPTKQTTRFVSLVCDDVRRGAISRLVFDVFPALE